MGEFLIATVLPYVLTFFFCGLVVTTCIYLPQLGKGFIKLTTPSKILLGVALILGAYIRFQIVPSTQRVLFDEDRYLSYAVSFAKFGKAISVDIATTNHSISGKPDQAVRSTVPVTNALVLYLSGFSESALYTASKIASVISIGLIFLLTALVFKKYTAAVLAALLMAFFPVVVYWSTSTGLDSYFMFWGLVTMVGAALYTRMPSVKSLLFFSFSLFLFLCVRVEAIILLPFAFGLIASIRKTDHKKIFTTSDYRLIAVVTPLILFRIFISITVLGQKWCCAEALPLEAFSLTYTIRNFLPNIISLFSRQEIPVIFTILAFIAAIQAFQRKNLPAILLAVWFIVYFGLYSSYYAGRIFTYEFSGSYGRFFLMLSPPFIMLAALALTELFSQFTHATQSKKFWLSIVVALMAVTLAPTIHNYDRLITISPFYNLVEKQPNELRTYVKGTMLSSIPPHALVIHNLTALFLLNGHDTVFFGSFLDDPRAVDFVVQALKHGQPVYSIEAPQCELFPQRCTLPAQQLRFEKIHPQEPESLQLEYMKVRLKKASESANLLYSQ